MSNIEKITWPGWETVGLIGRGSFGAVYEIQRDVLGDLEKAALKVISIPQNAGDIEEMYSDGYDDESITSTFQSHLKSIVAEYSLMRKMNGSANIVNCDDIRYIQHDDGIGWDIYIKMELLTPLTKALPSEIPEETVIKIGKDICKALVLCKKHEIVHRDIKPQNIFISPNGDYKLGDFGIAKTVEKTMGGTKIGTYKYMAPEVYNNQPYGAAADIYSLGLVLYWMLNERRMPFLPLPPAKLTAGADEQARYRRFSGEQIPQPTHGSDKLKQIVLKACAYDPKERYLTADEMLNALKALKGNAGETVPVISVSNNATSIEDPTDDIAGGSVHSDSVAFDSGTIEELAWIHREEAIDEPVLEEAPEDDLSVTTDSQNEAKEVPASKKKKKIGLLILPAAVLLLIVILFVIPFKGAWSQWQEQIPDAMEGRTVESVTQYSSRSVSHVVEERPHEGTYEGRPEYGQWSQWQEEEIPALGENEVESQMQYRSREILSEEVSEWGKWSEWTTKEAKKDENTKVETRTVYSYSGYRIKDTKTGAYCLDDLTWLGKARKQYDGDTPGLNAIRSWIVGNESGTIKDVMKKVNADSNYSFKLITKTIKSVDKELKLEKLDSKRWKFKDPETKIEWISSKGKPSKVQTQYRVKEKKVTQPATYSDWSEYTAEEILATETLEVETRMVYRQRTIDTSYAVFGEWSDWQTEVIPQAENTHVKNRILYRYRDKTTLWEILTNTAQ